MIIGIVPAVIEKIDSFIDSSTNDANAFVGIALFAQVIAAESDQCNALAGAAECSMWDTRFCDPALPHHLGLPATNKDAAVMPRNSLLLTRA
jgi:hypothetical protein